MYEIEVHRRFDKIYKRLDEKTKARVRDAVDGLIDNPRVGPNIDRLTGKLTGNYRLQIGGWRVVYDIDDEMGMILLKSLRSRGDVYKKGKF